MQVSAFYNDKLQIYTLQYCAHTTIMMKPSQIPSVLDVTILSNVKLRHYLSTGGITFIDKSQRATLSEHLMLFATMFPQV